MNSTYILLICWCLGFPFVSFSQDLFEQDFYGTSGTWYESSLEVDKSHFWMEPAGTNVFLRYYGSGRGVEAHYSVKKFEEGVKLQPVRPLPGSAEFNRGIWVARAPKGLYLKEDFPWDIEPPDLEILRKKSSLVREFRPLDRAPNFAKRLLGEQVMFSIKHWMGSTPSIITVQLVKDDQYRMTVRSQAGVLEGLAKVSNLTNDFAACELEFHDGPLKGIVQFRSFPGKPMEILVEGEQFLASGSPSQSQSKSFAPPKGVPYQEKKGYRWYDHLQVRSEDAKYFEEFKKEVLVLFQECLDVAHRTHYLTWYPPAGVGKEAHYKKVVGKDLPDIGKKFHMISYPEDLPRKEISTLPVWVSTEWPIESGEKFADSFGKIQRPVICFGPNCNYMILPGSNFEALDPSLRKMKDIPFTIIK